MSSPKPLIEHLRAAGELHSAGEFTLDQQKAQEKLRRYQLADPRTYVLSLVQAAVKKGATRIVFAIDANDMRMTFDGRPFARDALAHVYDAIFARGDDPDLGARRELAIGLNGAMALNPKLIRVHRTASALARWFSFFRT